MNIKFVLEYIKPFLDENGLISDEKIESIFSFCNVEEIGLIKNLIRSPEAVIVEAHAIEMDADEEIDHIVKQEKPITNKVIKKEKYGRNVTTLSNEHLCVMYQQGDNNAIDLLIRKNIGFIKSRALKYDKQFRHKLDLDDLIQAGVMGAMKAARKFKSDLDYKYSTYAGWWIDQAILREIMAHGFTVRMPVYVFERIRFINKLRYSCASYQEWIEKCRKHGFSEEKVVYLERASKIVTSITSLNVLVGEGSGTELIDMIPKEGCNSIDELAKSLLHERIDGLLEKLTERERKILKLRFGLSDDGLSHTLRGTAKHFGITRERVRQIEAACLQRLRRMMEKQEQEAEAKLKKMKNVI